MYMGLSHFEYELGSFELLGRIESIQNERLEMVNADSAFQNFRDDIEVCGEIWIGELHVANLKRSMLAFFHLGAEVVLSKLTWRNGNKLRDEVFLARNAADEMAEAFGAFISNEYCDLMMHEFDLSFQYKKIEHEEKEKLRAEAQVQREQKRLLTDIRKAEVEEKKLEALLARTKAEVYSNLDAYHQKVALLESELSEAHRRLERAKSMAQQTKRGFVYIISNPGSFGVGVHKIGMTRRLNPYERVLELGDASVPFRFDTHAMIYCDDAPSLEAKLHRIFDDKRVNTINGRKEFFRVSLEEIQEVVRQDYPETSFEGPDRYSDYQQMAELK